MSDDSVIVPSISNFWTGFISRTNSSYSFNDATRTFTVQPVGLNYSVFYHGKEIIISLPMAIIWPDVEGIIIFYIDNNGELNYTFDASLAFTGDAIPVAGIYWDAVNNKSIRRFEERHSALFPPELHTYLHRYVGTVWENGGSLGNFSVDGTGDLAINAQFSVADVTISDEDIRFPIANNFPQALSLVAQIPIYFLSGTTWREKPADVYPVIYSGTAGYAGVRLPYNQLIGANWQLTEVTNLNFVLMHYFATTDIINPIIGVVGQAIYLSQATARAGANQEISNILELSKLLSTEKRALGTVIYQTSGAYANVPKGRIRTTDIGENYVNWLETSIFTGVIK